MADAVEDLAEWRSRALDARILGRPVLPPPDMRDACTAWLAEVLPADPSTVRGLAAADVPAAWSDTLAWAGMPLSVAGPLRWGVDLSEAAIETPLLRDGRLTLPPPEALAQCTSLALKPMRRFVAERLGCRLQAAPGIRLWLWPGRAVLQSLSPIPLAGFVYGDAQGHRASLALDPFGHQVVTW